MWFVHSSLKRIAESNWTYVLVSGHCMSSNFFFHVLWKWDRRAAETKWAYSSLCSSGCGELSRRPGLSKGGIRFSLTLHNHGEKPAATWRQKDCIITEMIQCQNMWYNYNWWTNCRAALHLHYTDNILLLRYLATLWIVWVSLSGDSEDILHSEPIMDWQNYMLGAQEKQLSSGGTHL